MKRCGAAGRARAQCRIIRQTTRDFAMALLVFFTIFAFAALDARPAQPAPAVWSASQLLKLVDDPYAPIVRAQVKPDPQILPPSRAAAGTDDVPTARPVPAARLATIGIMALLFAAMSALTLGLWRHLGRTIAAPRRARQNPHARPKRR